jgi:hypothetical protein
MGVPAYWLEAAGLNRLILRHKTVSMLTIVNENKCYWLRNITLIKLKRCDDIVLLN